MISVVVPALNECETIGEIVQFALKDPRVSEVIVVDDGSIDGTPERANAAGARVVTSSLLGKGASMEDGLRAAANEIVVYLDGDLSNLRSDLISALTGPLIDGTSDFVKAKFSRTSGRVTTLTARPLLQTFFPELARFEQPLGGIVAAGRSLLARLRFENDYGVDVGLLIDASAAGARLAEVDIGRIEHDSHPLDVLGDMASQVVRVILDRAARLGRLNLNQIREVNEIERQQQAELSVVLEKLGRTERLALFDMDGVLLDGRFVVVLAERLKKSAHLAQWLDLASVDDEERTRQIAELFQGAAREEFEAVAREMPLMPGAVETVVGLRKAGYRVGIVTDSFRVAAEVVRRRVFADFSVAHVMRFRRGTATGQVFLAPAMKHACGCPRHRYCKSNVLRHFSERMGLKADQILAVGDGPNDICMLRAAGTSIAYRPRSPAVAAEARHIVTGSLAEIMKWIAT